MAERTVNLRRSSRLKTPVKQSNRDENEKTQLWRRIRQNSASGTDGEQSLDELRRELENELENIDEDTQKPTELYTEDQDVSGATMYTFPTPSKSGAMAQKAALSRTPATPKTPKHSSKQKQIVATARTPQRDRIRIKKELAVRGRREKISGQSSSENESESESESVFEEEEESESSTDSESDTEAQRTRRQTPVSKTVPMPTTSSSKPKRRARIIDNDYHLKTDEYFEMQSEKVVTSDRTLGRLVNPRIDEEKLQLLLANQNHVSKEHKQAIGSLSRDYKSLFPMWNYILEEGYSLLLHGLGSKRMLINNFREEILTDHPTLVVNGFFPSLTLKEILDGIIVDLLGLDSPSNPNECFNLIEKTLEDNPDDRLYLLIHNIDGLMLRSDKIQDTLSLLASIPNLSLVASIDHINTPMLWDNIKHSRYNFCWWDVTTLLPYEAETSSESSIMVQRSGALALSSLVNVILSLTTNARAIYILLVKDQLNHENNNTYLGMAFKDLYSRSREAFLVSSVLALRAQLTEFIDHKLVRSKRNLDGTEYLIIPLDNSLLKQFLDQQESA